MSTPASKPEFSKGVVEPVGDCGMFEAAIDHLTTDNNVMTPHGPDTDASKPPSDWGGRIVMYGKTAEQAEALRERILVALELCRGAEMEWLRGFNSNPHRLPVDQHIERAMGRAGAAEVELVRQVTDGGRNPRYEGLFEGESEEQRASRLAGDDDDQAYDIEAERLTYEALGPGAGINPNATSMDDIFLTESTGEVGERAAFEAWYLGHFYMGDKQCGLEWLSTEPCGGYRHQHPAEQWIVWQARAAISAPSHSEQVREIERLQIMSDNYCALLMDANQELADLKAQPRGVVRWPEADEIMQMAFEEGQPSEDASGYYFELEEFDLFIQRLMEEVARLNQPASAGEPLPHWEPCNPGCDPDFNGQRSRGCAHFCRPARAALSANHSEQVLEGWQLVPVEPIDAMLEAGDKYIGTPATYKAMLSACPSPAITKDFSQFLSAVMDAAGLIRHGRQSKELSEYLGMKCMEYRGAAPAPGKREGEWVPVSERLPDTKVGTEVDFIVAIRRAHNGKTYVVPASFLNRFELYSEDEAADDEGRIYVTGWYREMADDEHETAWHKMETEGDVITHWQELPAAPSAGSKQGGV